jgi:hypothetical protein
MNRSLLLCLLLLSAVIPAQADDFWHDTVRACIVGGGVIGATSALVLYPAALAGTTNMPATLVVFGNTVFGCGLGAIGMMSAHGISAAYDDLTSSPTPVPVPAAPANVEPTPAPDSEPTP